MDFRCQNQESFMHVFGSFPQARAFILTFSKEMKYYIKNMVCNRCKMVVKEQLEKAGLHPLSVDLGEVEIKETLSPEQKNNLNSSLR